MKEMWNSFTKCDPQIKWYSSHPVEITSLHMLTSDENWWLVDSICKTLRHNFYAIKLFTTLIKIGENAHKHIFGPIKAQMAQMGVLGTVFQEMVSIIIFTIKILLRVHILRDIFIPFPTYFNDANLHYTY